MQTAKIGDRIAFLVVVCGLDLRCLESGTYTREVLEHCEFKDSTTPNEFKFILDTKLHKALQYIEYIWIP